MDDTPTVLPAMPNALTKLQDFESLGMLQTQMQVFVLPCVWLSRLSGGSFEWVGRRLLGGLIRFVSSSGGSKKLGHSTIV